MLSSDILLEEARNAGIRETYSWLPRARLEEYCLKTYDDLPLSPLALAADALWPALVRKLLSNGANPWETGYCETEKGRLYRRSLLGCMLKARVVEKAVEARQSLTKAEEMPAVLRPINIEDLKDNITDARAALRKRFQGIQMLLSETTVTRPELLPNNVDVLKIFRKATTRLEAHNIDIQEEVAVVWSELSKVFGRLSKLPRDRWYGMVYSAAKDQNAGALKCFLQIGFHPDGGWWNAVLVTPYDTLRSRIGDEHDERTKQCMKLLESRSVRRGWVSLLEFHVPFALVSMAGFFCFPWICIFILKNKSDTWPDSAWPAAFLILAVIMGFVFWTVAWILRCLLLLIRYLAFRATPKFFTERGRPWWITSAPIGTVLLQMSMVSCLVALLFDEGDLDVVSRRMYGPTLSFLRLRQHVREDSSRTGSDFHQ